MLRRSSVRGTATLALSAALMLGICASANAHIQVAPVAAAPGDAVRFTVLIPGERSQETRRVDLKVPSGALPFSFGETPGWQRRTIPAANGAIDRIVWTGRLVRDGFAEFSFLAGTPERPGTLSWKALQTYSDGKVVRWIGPPGSEHPAPTTRIVAGVPAQNAGGEGAARGAAAVAVAAAPRATSGDSGDTDWLARGLALAALVASIAALVAMLRRAPVR